MGKVKWLRVVIGGVSVYLLALLLMAVFFAASLIYPRLVDLPPRDPSYSLAVSNSVPLAGTISILFSTVMAGWWAARGAEQAKPLNGLLVGGVVWLIAELLFGFDTNLFELLNYALILLAGWIGGWLDKRRHEIG